MLDSQMKIAEKDPSLHTAPSIKMEKDKKSPLRQLGLPTQMIFHDFDYVNDIT